MDIIEIEFIMCANCAANGTIYKEALMESNSYDFMVFRFTEWGEVSEDLEE
ncbi:hypothetical protein [Tenacibaculum sp.]|uniref:hypothetical protein n=1 Tax=Tenacibaculum sp. TaxID=1906242 RepID=UPI003D0D5BEF